MNASKGNVSIDNSTASPKHILAPVPAAIFTAFSILTAIYGLVVNTLVLCFMEKVAKRRRQQIKKAFSRNLTFVFVQSLAWSNLSSLMGMPIVLINTYFIQSMNDWYCKAATYFIVFARMATISNLLLIGIERYLAVCHPFVVPSDHVVKRLVLGTWVIAGLTALIPSSINKHSYTYQNVGHQCMYDERYFPLVFSISVLINLIPNIALLFLSIQIVLTLRRKTLPKNSMRFHGTKTFVILIFTSFLPILVFILGIALSSIANNYSVSWKKRGIAQLSLVSSCVSATIILYRFPDLRELSKTVFRKIICCKGNTHVFTDEVVSFDARNETVELKEIRKRNVVWVNALPERNKPSERTRSNGDDSQLNVVRVMPA